MTGKQMTIFDLSDNEIIKDTVQENELLKELQEKGAVKSPENDLLPYDEGDKVYIDLGCTEDEDPDFGNDIAMVYHHELSICPPEKK
jgi:hypothetical protein